MRESAVQQKTVLITGCSSGIGRALVWAFIERGCFVYASARNPAQVDLPKGDCEALKLDVNSEEEIRAALEAIRQKHGRLDILVNNAGMGRFGLDRLR